MNFLGTRRHAEVIRIDAMTHIGMYEKSGIKIKAKARTTKAFKN